MTKNKDNRYDPDKMMEIAARLCKLPYGAIKTPEFQNFIFKAFIWSGIKKNEQLEQEGVSGFERSRIFR